MTLFTANDLFSHPETHQPQAESGPAGSDRPSWTNLFQEPVPAPRVPSEH
ncbi:hypothetical protein [Lentzea albida]|uniref:Uncharacterized protein n=1 Tax=Lentzea albida TaxID=65499 RepID=A0A1H9V8G9_9PSEU|nr:hypothetical protein [Lentzea albida]SES17563.1 hypothetical protein SAMN04488000_11787 [Lentzea albida]